MSRIAMRQRRSTAKTDPLLAAFNITAQDVRANRDGTLGKRQVGRLRQRRWDWIGWLVAALLLTPIFSVPLIERTIFAVTHGYISSSYPIYILIGLAPFLLVWYTMRGLSRVSADIADGRVAAATGKLTTEARTRGDRVIERTLTIEDRRFVVRQRVYDAFNDGTRYRLYYAPRTHVLLGAEQLQL